MDKAGTRPAFSFGKNFQGEDHYLRQRKVSWFFCFYSLGAGWKKSGAQMKVRYGKGSSAGMGRAYGQMFIFVANPNLY